MTRSLQVVLAFLLLFVLVGGVAIAQTPDPALPVQGAASHEAAIGQAPATIVTSSGVFDIPSGTVSITALGALPANITVTVGAQVFWVNDTATAIRVSDKPLSTVRPAQALYLPMVATTNGQTSDFNWISPPIAPGGRYTRIFGAAGAFLYHTSHLTGTVGIVTVVSDTLASTVYMDAELGGIVRSGDAALHVPPHALAQDAVITVRRPISGASLASDGTTAVALDSDSLALNAPLTLTLSYDEPAAGLYEELISVVAYDEATDTWEPQEIIAFDTTANTVSIKVEHFSWRVFYIDEPLYIGMNLAPEYLHPGDILVRMNGHYDPTKPNNGCDGTAVWFPGHTAIYSDTVEGQGRVIESNSYDNATNFACGTWSGGVRIRRFIDFHQESCDFYMGARRKEDATVDQQKTALDYAVQRLGDGYLAVGQGNVHDNCYSPTGLVEAAYDAAGASLIPWNKQAPFITPLQKFQKTVPVNEIEVDVRKQIYMEIKGFYKIAQPAGGGHYEIRHVFVAGNSLPDGSTYLDGRFVWMPRSEQGGKDYTVHFLADTNIGGKLYTVDQPLIIHVRAGHLPTPPEDIDTAEEVLIPAGNFQMGCDANDAFSYRCNRDEKPLHTVYLDAYYIDKYEVTNARYQECVAAGSCTAPDQQHSSTRTPYYGNPTYDGYPVINVDWFQAAAFCAWEGKRLPTEAEWEKAARGSLDARHYPWGNTDPTCENANSATIEPGAGLNPCVSDTAPVGSYSAGASPYGVMDTVGNVKEWVNDRYADDYYSSSPVNNPQGPATGGRVVRGGSWRRTVEEVRTAYRTAFSEDSYFFGESGFRCARTP